MALERTTMQDIGPNERASKPLKRRNGIIRAQKVTTLETRATPADIHGECPSY